MKKRFLVLLLALTAVFYLSNLCLADTASASYRVSSDSVAISDGGTQSSANYGILGVGKVYELGRVVSSTYNVILGFFASFSAANTNPPSAEAFSSRTTTAIQANWSANGNPAGTRYYCENITKATNSGWITDLSWKSTTLEALTAYQFRVKAMTPSRNESSWTALGVATTEDYATLDASVAGVSLKDGDAISSTLTITVSLTSETTVSSLSLKPLATLGGVKSVQVDGVAVAYDIISSTSTSITIRLRDALSTGTHTVKIITFDTAGMEYVLERTGLTVSSGSVTTSGPTLVYPNPYDPLAGNLKITYYLSVDTGTTIYVIDTSGRVVWKSNYLSGTNGGKAGYNEISWNTVGTFGQLTSDAYIVSVIEQGTGKMITKTKLLLWKGGAR